MEFETQEEEKLLIVSPKVDQISDNEVPDIQQKALELIEQSKTNLILNLAHHSIAPDIDPEPLVPIANKLEALQKSFVIAVDNQQIKQFGSKNMIAVTPTLDEARDMVFMEELERDLGEDDFDEEDDDYEDESDFY